MILDISSISFIKYVKFSSSTSNPSLIRHNQYFDSFADFKLISLYLINSLLLDELCASTKLAPIDAIALETCLIIHLSSIANFCFLTHYKNSTEIL